MDFCKLLTEVSGIRHNQKTPLTETGLGTEESGDGIMVDID